MSNYTGLRCTVCSEKFTEADDIVVCPECGTPYHKDCYKKEGKCVNTALHESGGTWKPSYDTGSDGSENEAVVCKFCGYANPPLTLFCQKCGMPAQGLENINTPNIVKDLGANGETDADGRDSLDKLLDDHPLKAFMVNYSDPLCGFNPEEDFDGVKMSELGDFVGTNTHYYLPAFKKMKQTKGRFMTFNFSALLVPELYFSYRKMPLYALAALIARFVLLAPRFIYVCSLFPSCGALYEFASRFDFAGTAFRGVTTLCTVVTYLLMFTAGVFGNKIYFGHVLKKIRTIKEYCADGEPTARILHEKGGTSGLWLTLFICLMAVPYIFLSITQFSNILKI
ncbi:MAG: hypothetical protein NC085_13040 [Muribaculaceae bacterium]|nr:hypothetical protein [Muribaculaceae bacterium]